MGFPSIKKLFEDSGLATSTEFESWHKSWTKSQENGENESMLTFFAREKGLADDLFMQTLSKALGWDYADLRKLSFTDELGRKITTKVAFQNNVIPTSFEEDHLCVAVCNPFDSGLLNEVQFNAQCRVSFALAPETEIQKALTKFYGVGAQTLDEMENDDDEPIEILLDDDKEIEEGDQEASVIKFVNQIIWEAFKDRATDIHFEPSEDELRIRYRVDGILLQAPMPPQLKRYQSSLISRIKIMSGMDIAEKRLPQDGRINVRIKGEELDIRVSTVPTVHGESVSLRLLTRGTIFLTLDKLGFPQHEMDALKNIIVKPHGIVLVTGPTGSGKSTSLYAFLSTINSVSKRIITIEEPVEYELKGINQIAARPDIGLTFAMGLRHILRQDPDVVMVGEIRDTETAEISIRAALTGHLVFSTLHTNDAPSAFTRLIDMGIEPFLVASSVEAVLAQRLVRTICKFCKTEQTIDPDYLKRAGVPESEIAQSHFWHGPGCEECRNTGYKGRTGIHELLIVSETHRPLILNRAAAATISRKSIEMGMQTLRMDGLEKARKGVTTLEEVIRVTQSEEHLDSLIESN
ncbi:MAG TPA: type II/IV secretion system protein [Verrucomicrobiales bacterium]|nr:type II/IV secretion system protein [Verrucomicrobiales bacterium]HIL69967.1 type II/IV secretion system protein [Verrucomicrobiota bacterium]